MEPAPLRNDLAEGPDEGTAWWVHASDGVRLRMGGWREGPKGTVLIFTGRTEYIEKYGRMAETLHAAGLATAAIDWRGQGLSDRVASDPNIGHVRDFGDYQLDTDAFVEAVRASEFPEPYFLLGHSLGGAIGLRSLTRGLPFARAVFSGPMWGIDFPVWLRPFVGLILDTGHALSLGLAYAPGTGPVPYPIQQPFRTNRLTSDRETYEWMRAHIRAETRLGLGGPSVIWLRQALREAASLHAVREVPCPTLTLIGGEEDTVDPEAARRLGASWENGRVETVEGALHEAMMERPEIRADFTDRALRHFLGD